MIPTQRYLIRCTASSLLLSLCLCAAPLLLAQRPQKALQITPQSKPPANSLTLWYQTPAQKWTDALPIGNGRLGAMIFGNPSSEKLQLNDITVWSGGPRPDANRPRRLPCVAGDPRRAGAWRLCRSAKAGGRPHDHHGKGSERL